MNSSSRRSGRRGLTFAPLHHDEKCCVLETGPLAYVTWPREGGAGGAVKVREGAGKKEFSSSTSLDFFLSLLFKHPFKPDFFFCVCVCVCVCVYICLCIYIYLFI